MVRTATRSDVDVIRAAAHPISGSPGDDDALIQRIGEAPFVLLGEATHGTHEFYAARARITQRLIAEHGFTAVAVEADWPDAYRVNRFVQGQGNDAQAIEALGDFTRFPTWMWRNADVLDFVRWLHGFNRDRPTARRVGFYGLDLYSLYRSIEAVLHYLDRVDPEAAQRARQRYACFDHAAEDPQRYGYAAAIGTRRSCEDEAVAQLIDLRDQAQQVLQRDGLLAEDEQFFAERNAQLVREAERYYRSMFGGRVNTWNLRDRHMAETLAALHDHLTRRHGQARVVVWEHNSHIGDARATEMGAHGELNLGQLTRQRYGADVVLVGFTTYTGTVSAASAWDAPVERKRVRPARPDSHEHLLHETAAGRFALVLDSGEHVERLRQTRLERAIGVIYRPETERASHYFDARLADQFDVVVHFDETRAVEPIDRAPTWQRGEPPETYPFGV